MGQLSPIFSKVRIGGYRKEGVKVPIIAVGSIRSFSTPFLLVKNFVRLPRGTALYPSERTRLSSSYGSVSNLSVNLLLNSSISALSDGFPHEEARIAKMEKFISPVRFFFEVKQPTGSICA